jgi:hypothetical protein
LSKNIKLVCPSLFKYPGLLILIKMKKKKEIIPNNKSIIVSVSSNDVFGKKYTRFVNRLTKNNPTNK